VLLHGHVDSAWRFRFGIDRYFVPEGTPTPDRRDITVRLRIDKDGGARIEQVYVHDEPWPERR
jgi:uncharacterized membrane-anchored protein